MSARIRRSIPLVLGLLAVASLPSTVRAQGNTFNPYGNSGYADYREFGTPMISNNPALPGQALLNSEPLITRPRSNSFQQYSDELNGVESDPRSSRGRAVPGETYFQAYQRMNSRYNRVYKPNDTPENREFERKRQERDALYAKALAEPDPAKRAKLLRQVQQDTIGLNRPATPARRKAAPGTTAAPGTRVAPAPAPISRAPSPYPSSAAGERRTPPPSPYGTSRAPGTSGTPTRRAPSPYRALEPESTAPRPDSTGRAEPSSRPAPDPSNIPIPPPR